MGAAGRMAVCLLWGDECPSRWSNTHAHSDSNKWTSEYDAGGLSVKTKYTLHTCMELSKANVKSNLEIRKD